ncbi:MAG: chemotaxis protein CheA [Bdellovibrionales bacterium]
MDKDLLNAFLEDAKEVLEEWVRTTLKLRPTDSGDAYSSLMRCAHNLKGSAGLAGLSALHAAIHRAEDHLVELRDSGRGADEKVVGALLQTEKMLQRWIASMIQNPQHIENADAVERAWTDILKGAKSSSPIEPKVSVQPENVSGTRRKSSSIEESLRVAVRKVDRVIQLAGELSLHQSIIGRASREGTLETPAMRAIVDLSLKITQDLQDAALNLRMIPIDYLFQRVERVARETAGHLEKKVIVKRAGGEVTVDKLVMEGMLDPLIHIARNAIDHGIEPQADRVLAGKSPSGEIRVSAEYTASGISLKIEDDGRGIDGDKVYEKALAKGLISPDVELGPKARQQLIFLPGLSTAEQVTELSGRGVGMDVVAENVRRLGGRVDVESQPGQGTRFSISLPTNLSIVDALVVRAAGSQYAVPNQDLSEVIDLREFRLTPVNGGERSVIDLRGQLVSVAKIENFLDGATSFTPLENAPAPGTPQPGIVIQHQDEWLALAVESVIGQQQVFVRPLSDHLSPITFYGGSTILSDGEPTLILNLPEMARRYFLAV